MFWGEFLFFSSSLPSEGPIKLEWKVLFPYFFCLQVCVMVCLCKCSSGLLSPWQFQIYYFCHFFLCFYPVTLLSFSSFYLLWPIPALNYSWILKICRHLQMDLQERIGQFRVEINESYRLFPSVYLSLLSIWLVSTFYWTINTYKNRHFQAL